jgi:hypothetical protein
MQAGRRIVANRAQDIPYLQGLVTDIEAEMAEREDLESMVITKRQQNANAQAASSNKH